MDTTTTVILVIGAFSLATAAIIITKAFGAISLHRAELREKNSIIENGLPGKAVIESIQPTNAQLDDHPIVTMEVTVTAENGEVFRAPLRTAVPIIRVPEFQQGRTIDVKYAVVEGRMKVVAVGAYHP
ncbi:hypothetical protein [Cohnella boryungensis]|uniref:DUF3592 domain-containing protein n=1 Tax=Cohnella boryungensis TaxID=768479 RepID=A0ABV8S7U9_9BACL